MTKAVILLGSNIDPNQNLRRAVDMLRLVSPVVRCSSVWRTRAVGSTGPDFLNMALILETELTTEALKFGVLRPIEAKLGRVRTSDKNAPRTIDLDVVVLDDRILDEDLWRRAHLAIPVAELMPALRSPETFELLADVAQRLKADSGAEMVSG